MFRAEVCSLLRCLTALEAGACVLHSAQVSSVVQDAQNRIPGVECAVLRMHMGMPLKPGECRLGEPGRRRDVNRVVNHGLSIPSCCQSTPVALHSDVLNEVASHVPIVEAQARFSMAPPRERINALRRRDSQQHCAPKIMFATRGAYC